ncbi:hypothetical protein VF34_01415 [Rhodococcus sp. PML026]|nr:hypothetical protein VF34_01415 [Rhodococcus sp. PML026]
MSMVPSVAPDRQSHQGRKSMTAVPFASPRAPRETSRPVDDFRPYAPTAAAPIIDGVHCSTVENGTGF